MNVDVRDIEALGQTYPEPYIFDIDKDMNGKPADWIYPYLQITAAHELFHNVQFEYVFWDTWPIIDEDFSTMWIMEGTAQFSLAIDNIEDENCPYYGGNTYANLLTWPEGLSPGNNYSYIWETIFSWASDYFEFNVSSNVDTIYINCEALSGDIFWQVMPLRDSTAVLVYESGMANYSLSLHNDSFDNLVIIPVGREEDGLYNLCVSTVGSGNSPPILSNGSVTPSSGNTSTVFTYEVTYSDPDGDEPSVHQVYIDGVSHDMSFMGG